MVRFFTPGWLLICLLTVWPQYAASAASPWTARYAALTSLTDAQIAGGYLPTWHMTFPADASGEVYIDDDAKGNALGYGLVGLPLHLPVPTSVTIQISLEYQVQCAEPHRSGNLDFFLYTENAWNRLPQKSGAPVKLPLLDRTDGVGIGAMASTGGEDVTTWTPWQSINLAPTIRQFHGQQLIFVVRLTGYHFGAKESARVRNVAIATSNTPLPPRQRQRLYPLKTARTLTTDAEIALARENCQKYPAAVKIRDGIIAAAAPWLKRSDEELLRLIPPASVPRAFNVSAAGCPIHGKAIYRFGTYPWILDVNHPYVIECPIGHEKYPSNDFQRYLQSGYKDTTGFDSKYADDGWGWYGPDGERYWLVAYACHWHWDRFILPAVNNLARAYVLTGDQRYAHKAALMLAEIAYQYPSFNYATQSRYGWLQNGSYPGKILNHIWETGTLRNLAADYDDIWETIDGDTDLQRLRHQSGAEIRSMIEANLLEEGIEAVLDGRIEGNFGMHQNTLATAAICRQQGPVKEWLNRILTHSGGATIQTGLNYALYNFVYRDGMPNETSPGYCFIWPDTIIGMAEVLKKGGIDLYRLPKLKSLAEAPLQLHIIGKFTPDEGDSGSVYGGLAATDPNVYQPVYRAYHDPAVYAWLKQLDATGNDGFRTYESLFLPPIEAADVTPKTPRSRLLDGYGMTILNDAANRWGISLYYGFRGGHSHRDTLNFDLYANGQKMMPDLGYPDAMNAFVSGIYTWTKNTVAHNCVMIDHRQQDGNGPGEVTRFFSAGGVHAVEASAPTAYTTAKEYRRGMVMVETESGRGYLIDIFRVAGGSDHSYSLHGPPGTFQTIGGEWTDPQPGTLAGPDVPVGAPYDDPALNKPGYRGGYSGYLGSGFSHFVHVQRLKSGSFVAEYAHAHDANSHLRIHLLPDSDQQVLLADAQVSPLIHKELVKYILSERHGANLVSTFASLCEPYRDTPEVQQVSRVAMDGGLIFTVTRQDAVDVILYRLAGTGELKDGDISTDGDIAVVSRGKEGQLRRAVFYGGRWLTVGNERLTHAPLHGKVISLDPPHRTVVVHFDTAATPAMLIGAYPAFARGNRTVRHPVVAARQVAQGIELTLGDDILIGRGQMGKVDGKRVDSPTAFTFPAIYPGASFTDEKFQQYLPVLTVADGGVELRQPVPAGLLTDGNGDGVTDFWLCSFGPGAAVTLEGTTAVSR